MQIVYYIIFIFLGPTIQFHVAADEEKETTNFSLKGITVVSSFWNVMQPAGFKKITFFSWSGSCRMLGNGFTECNGMHAGFSLLAVHSVLSYL